jgi:hypothetical protein
MVRAGTTRALTGARRLISVIFATSRAGSISCSLVASSMLTPAMAEPMRGCQERKSLRDVVFLDAAAVQERDNLAEQDLGEMRG